MFVALLPRFVVLLLLSSFLGLFAGSVWVYVALAAAIVVVLGLAQSLWQVANGRRVGAHPLDWFEAPSRGAADRVSGEEDR